MAEMSDRPKNEPAGFREKVIELQDSLTEIIFQRRLGTRQKFFLKGTSDTNIYGTKAGVNDRIESEIQEVDGYAGAWTADTAKEVASFVEGAVIVFSSLTGWLGRKTEIRKTAREDDVKRQTDFWGIWFATRENGTSLEHVVQGAGVDLNSSARGAMQKLSTSFEKIYGGTLHSLRFVELHSDKFGFDMKGAAEHLPHFQLVVSAQRAREWVNLLDNEEWTKIGAHPAQIELLQQLRAQARLMGRLLRSLKGADLPAEITKLRGKDRPANEETRRLRMTKGYAPGYEDSYYLKKQFVKAFDDCEYVFNQALQERVVLLEKARTEGSDSVREMLASYQPDKQHLSFMHILEGNRLSDDEASTQVMMARRARAIVAHTPPAYKRNGNRIPKFKPRRAFSKKDKPPTG